MGQNVRFHSYNYITASSELGASSGTDSLSNLIDKNSNTTWTSVSQGTDGTAGTVTFTPTTAPVIIDRFFMQNHNGANYKLYYDGGTANTFTPDVLVTGNAGEDSYHEFGTQSVNSVTLSMTHTIVAGQEKSVGQMFLGTQISEPTNNPADYNPIIRKKGYDLEMADGGAKSIWLGDKFYASLNWQFVGETEKDAFDSLYDAHSEFYFMPTPVETGTGWDGDAWVVNWVGDKDTEKVTNGIGKTTGYDINMTLWEVSG